MSVTLTREQQLAAAREQGVRDRNEALLAQPEWQPLIRRIGEAVDPSFPHRMEVVRSVVLDVIAARACPRNPVNPCFKEAA